MDKRSDLLARAAGLNYEARELEAQARAQDTLGAHWYDMTDEFFNKVANKQIEADWYFQLADTARRAAKKKRKEAIKFEKKANRLPRRNARS